MTRKDARLDIVLAPDEKALIEAAAKASDMTRSAWLRTTALREARKVLAKVKEQGK